MARIYWIPLLLCAAAIAASPQAQPINVTPYAPVYMPYAPEVHLGSATTPTIVNVPPVLQVTTGLPAPAAIADVPPASTALLATRHFDFIVSLVEGPPLSIRGSMEDSAVSLGEYARQLRSRSVTTHPPVITLQGTPDPN
jgi:hypothetical protein